MVCRLLCACGQVCVFVCALQCCVEQQYVTLKRECSRRSGKAASRTSLSCVHGRGLLLEPKHLHMRPCVGHAASTSPMRKQALHNTTACCTQQCTPWALCIGSRLLRAPRRAARHDLFPALLLEVHQRWQGFSRLRLSLRTLHPLGTSGTVQCYRPVCVMPFRYGSPLLCCDVRVLCLGGRPCLLSRATRQSIAYCACCTPQLAVGRVFQQHVEDPKQPCWCWGRE